MTGYIVSKMLYYGSCNKNKYILWVLDARVSLCYEYWLPGKLLEF